MMATHRQLAVPGLQRAAVPCAPRMAQCNAIENGDSTRVEECTISKENPRDHSVRAFGALRRKIIPSTPATIVPTY